MEKVFRRRQWEGMKVRKGNLSHQGVPWYMRALELRDLLSKPGTNARLFSSKEAVYVNNSGVLTMVASFWWFPKP